MTNPIISIDRAQLPSTIEQQQSILLESISDSTIVNILKKVYEVTKDLDIRGDLTARHIIEEAIRRAEEEGEIKEK